MSTESEAKSPFQQIEERCQRANIQISRINVENINKGFYIELSAGENSIFFNVVGEARANLLLQKDVYFEKVSGISGYYAYYSIEDKYIEAMLECEYGGMPLGHYSIYERGIKSKINNQEENSRSIIKIKNDIGNNFKLSVGLSTPTFSALQTLKEPFFQGQRIDYTTIRIEQVEIESHEQALEILEKLAYPLLFELNYVTGLPIFLASRTVYSNSHYEDEIGLSENNNEINLELRHYDKEPMSLYRYANTAAKMPLVQYLAYYQVIEFYFPRFTEQEALKIMKQKINEPSFYEDLNINIYQLFKDIKKPLSCTNERECLKLIIKNCITQSELESFFEEKDNRKKFFKNYEKWKDITEESSPLREQGDIINDTARRIYDIRCKIVHTKDSDSSDKKFIQPFSEAAQKLGYDIELVQFIARQVLRTCSEPLEINTLG